MASTPFLTSGRVVLTLVSIFTSTSCYVADYNTTHVYNPNWPPHAKFHNGQTMTMGALLGLTTLYFTWRHKINPALYGSSQAMRDSLFTAAVVGSLYWLTGMTAILYPGTAWMDPEFIKNVGDDKLLGLPGQLVPFSMNFVLAWVGYVLGMKGLEGSKRA